MPNSIQKPRTSRLPFRIKSLAVLTLISIAVTSCARQLSSSVELASENISNSLGCVDSKSKIFDAFYLLLDQDQVLPDRAALKASLEKRIDELVATKQITPDDGQVNRLKNELAKLVDSLLAESKNNPSLTWKEQIQKLIEYEMEDQSSVAIMASTETINSHVKNIKALSQDLKASCLAPITNSSPANETNQQPQLAQLPSADGKVAIGLNRVVATAYQSCRVLDLPAMDGSTPDVSGILKNGTHADGIGGKRQITNLAAVQNSHYYIRGIATESNCAPVRNNPLIYDYGGEPSISGNTINFLKNAGTGTDALGVDCSAFVSSSIAVAGLRYKPSVDNKPIFIRQSSAKFIDAAKSGFTCFDNITVENKKSILPGDIVGVRGHVVAVDKIGDDPFGLKLLKSSAECAKINYKDFDFSVTQSSPSKNGIGINKYVARDYLDESVKMKTAFVEMGKQACLAYFQNKSIKPKSSEWGFLRHNGTAQCLAKRVNMSGESCTKSCF